MRKLFHSKTNPLLKKLYPSLIWDFYNKETKAIFLTFDDGPTPGVTDKALDILKAYGAKATFFCKGINVEKHPELYKRILSEGHDVGNHTFNHLKGWYTKNKVYFEDIRLARKLIDSPLFRPPYGKITFPQVWELKKNYKIIMWDIMSFDYDNNISQEQCAKNVIDNLEPGSIVTYHDSVPASQNMLFALKRTLDFAKDKYQINKKLTENF